MSDFHLRCYLNEDRPQLHCPIVTVLPSNTLGPDQSSQLLASLQIDSSNGPECAASARFWERLLETYRLPYLLLRVADMRMSLGSEVTALKLYEELQAMLRDPQFEHWCASCSAAILAERERQLKIFKSDGSLGFSPSQRWRSTEKMDNALPYCKLQRAEVNFLYNQWRNTNDVDDLMVKFVRLHCLESVAMEGVFQFNPTATSSLVCAGFDDRAGSLVDEGDIIGGVVQHCTDALSILRDTSQALSDMFTLVDADTFTLTVETICHLHETLMQTSRVLSVDMSYGHRLSYLNIGITRQTTRVNVTATMRDHGVKIQFCPYDDVDKELDFFCRRFNELIRDVDMDPFAAAAWICHVFVTIHPFEDGNGRLSRILASIPLVRKGLPPLCILTSCKVGYNILHNNVRANRDGDYRRLMQFLYDGTKASLAVLKGMV